MALSATTIWEIRSDGSPYNGGGYNTAAGTTDYSDRATPILTVTDAACTTGGVIVTSATGGFTAAMVGSVVYLEGTHFVSGWYEIKTYTDTNTITVDRDPTDGSNASSGTLRVGGALQCVGDLGAIFQTAAHCAAGMQAYLRNTGTTYTYESATVNTRASMPGLYGGPLDLDATEMNGKTFLLKGYDPAYGRESFLGTAPTISNGDVTPTNMVKLKGAASNPHSVAFIFYDGNSKASSGVYGVNYCYATGCVVKDCDGTYGFYNVTLTGCLAQSCDATGFYSARTFGCVADACRAGFTYCAVAVCCVAKNGTGSYDGFYGESMFNLNCVAYDNGGDGFDSSYVGVFVNCVAWGNGGYDYNTRNKGCQLINCAGDGGASGRSNAAPFFDLNPIILTPAGSGGDDPFNNAAALDFSLKSPLTGTNALLLKGAGYAPYGQTRYGDVGAVQHGPNTYPSAANVLTGTGLYGPTGAEFTPSGSGGGGYTYGDEDPDEVLTTATGAGNYEPVDPSDVRAGVDVGVSPAVGTLVIPAEADVREAEEYGADAEFTGTLDLPAEADVKNGVKYDGETKEGTYDPGGGGVFMPTARQIGV